MNLLIVEDDVSMLTVLARTFEHWRFVVDRCMDGRAALERMTARYAAAVILDLTPPELVTVGTSGYAELAPFIRDRRPRALSVTSEHRLPGIPIPRGRSSACESRRAPATE